MSEAYIGEIRLFAGNYAPEGWAMCDGRLLAIGDNDALFSLIGTTYGGDGRTSFALPDLRGPHGAGFRPGVDATFNRTAVGDGKRLLAGAANTCPQPQFRGLHSCGGEFKPCKCPAW